ELSVTEVRPTAEARRHRRLTQGALLMADGRFEPTRAELLSGRIVFARLPTEPLGRTKAKRG
ncbi:MAG: hypothetical protein ABI706_03005, partial [Ilumatobacteraceae bacterium]